MSEYHGHMTLEDGSHVPLTADQAKELWDNAEKARAERAARLPDEQSAIKAMFDAYDRLRELGWSDPIYCPKDGTTFKVIENGSTGISDCVYSGEWPKGCYWITFDAQSAYPLTKPPALFRLYPEDEAKCPAITASTVGMTLTKTVRRAGGSSQLSSFVRSPRHDPAHRADRRADARGGGSGDVGSVDSQT